MFGCLRELQSGRPAQRDYEQEQAGATDLARRHPRPIRHRRAMRMGQPRRACDEILPKAGLVRGSEWAHGSPHLGPFPGSSDVRLDDVASQSSTAGGLWIQRCPRPDLLSVPGGSGAVATTLVAGQGVRAVRCRRRTSRRVLRFARCEKLQRSTGLVWCEEYLGQASGGLGPLLVAALTVEGVHDRQGVALSGAGETHAVDDPAALFL